MKKIIAAILIIATVFACVGCTKAKKYKDGDTELHTLTGCSKDYIDGLKITPYDTNSLQPIMDGWVYRYTLDDGTDLKVHIKSGTCYSLDISGLNSTGKYSIYGVHIGDTRMGAITAGIDEFSSHHTSEDHGSYEIITFKNDDGDELEICVADSHVTSVTYTSY